MLESILIGFVVLPLVMMVSTAFANPPAGVIAYTCKDKEALVLLAYDNGKNRNGWAPFGGRAEEGETIAQTASREFREETGCVFAGPTPEQLETQQRSRIGPFYTYVSRVNWVDPVMMAASSCGTPGERSKWVWVNLEQLNQALDSGKNVVDRDNPVVEYPLWIAGRVSLQVARSDGLLPASSDVCVVMPPMAGEETAAAAELTTIAPMEGNTMPAIVPGRPQSEALTVGTPADMASGE